MRKILCLCFLFLLILITGCSEEVSFKSTPSPIHKNDFIQKEIPQIENPSKIIELSRFNQTPAEWGENVTGVKTKFITNKKEIALTLDACGGEYGSDVDEPIISFLKEEQIPATLFVNQRWIVENETLFLELVTNPLFQIENHGSEHSPLSVNGGEAWGIPATESPEEVYDEIMLNHDKVKELTGREMTLFRSGTAYYDEVAVEIANELGYTIVNFDILGDAGATYTSEQVKSSLLTAQNGSIVLLHMNQPKSGTADGVKSAVPLLKESGFEFVLLENKTLE